MSKKCPHTIILMDEKGNTKWQTKKPDRKIKVCFKFIDTMIEENWLSTTPNKQESLIQLIKHLQARNDWTINLLRARFQGGNEDETTKND